MGRPQLLTRLSLAATLLLVTIGGLVRATKSGLGCGTDWPHCAGRLVPALETRAELIEFSHRAAALAVIVLLGLLAITAVRDRRRDPGGAVLAAAALGLVLFQAVLGAIVVKLELEAVSVVLHLGAAMALLGLLVFMTLREHPSEAAAHLARPARWVAGSVLVLLLVGSYVSGVTAEHNAGFPDWPLVDGSLVPDLSVEIFALHWFHRLLALLVGLAVLLLALRGISTGDPAVARLSWLAAGGFVTEIIVGAANVWTQGSQGVNSIFITMHLSLGAIIWASLVAFATISRSPETEPSITRSRTLRPEGAR